MQQQTSRQELIRRIKSMLIPEKEYVGAFYIKTGDLFQCQDGQLRSKDECMKIPLRADHRFFILPASQREIQNHDSN